MKKQLHMINIMHCKFGYYHVLFDKVKFTKIQKIGSSYIMNANRLKLHASHTLKSSEKSHKVNYSVECTMYTPGVLVLIELLITLILYIIQTSCILRTWTADNMVKLLAEHNMQYV